MKKLSFIVMSIILLAAPEVFAAALYAGYNQSPWGSDIKNITRSYPKGKMAKLGAQDTYKQLNPTKEIKQRTFAFTNNKLVAVSITFDPAYVKKAGLEKLLAKQKKVYGEGAIDRTGAPHMVTYRWQDQATKITYAYAPKKPEMTVMMYEKK